MIGLTRSFVLMLVLMWVAAPPAYAGDVKILKAAVSNSVGSDGVSQLNLHLLINTTSSEPTSVIAYFSDGETGEPLSAPSGSEFGTKSGQLAARSGLVPGTTKSATFEKKISVPHFAFDFEPLKTSKVRISLFLDPGSSSSSEELTFADELGFDFTVENPFKHGKHGKKKQMIDVLRPRFRDLLPDRPVHRMDSLARWNAYTAFNPSFPPALLEELATTIFVEKGRTVSMGGNAAWRHEGSGMDWQALYDVIDARQGIVLPRVRSELNHDRFPPKQVMINARLLEVDGRTVPSSAPSVVSNPVGPQVMIDARIVETDGRNVKFDFDATRVEAHTQVPVLSKIPAIGGLFSRGESIRNQRTLLIFITPMIVQEE